MTDGLNAAGEVIMSFVAKPQRQPRAPKTPRPPMSLADFEKIRKPFEEWLVGHGSAILATTNIYETARFLTDIGIGVVYHNSAGKITHWTNGANRACAAFLNREPWRAVVRGARGNSKKKHLFNTLAARDGANCVYCGCGLTIDDATIEHFVAVTHGGPDHPANLTLACRPHNTEAGHLSVREKVEMALRLRGGGMAGGVL
jgi:hypothetical protein